MALAAEHGFPHWSRDGDDLARLGARPSGRRAGGGHRADAPRPGRQAGDRGAAQGALRTSACWPALRRGGRAAEALRLLAEALARVEATGERWFEAELHRLRGEALLGASAADRAEAEACFRKALDVAREQGAKWWELRAATSLARLWAEHGERRKAHDLLAPIYGWFTEGFDTPDLRKRRRCSTRSDDAVARHSARRGGSSPKS